MKKIFPNVWIIFAMVLLSFTRSNPICNHEIRTENNHFFPSEEKYVSDVETDYIDQITIDPGFFSDTINWKLLNQLEYKEENHDAYGVVMMPVFSKNV